MLVCRVHIQGPKYPPSLKLVCVDIDQSSQVLGIAKWYVFVSLTKIKYLALI